MVCLLSPVSISLQYGDMSSYNEIEHSETIPFTELNEEIKHKLKICQDLFQFDLKLEKLSLKISSEIFDDLKNQVNLAISTPPPEFV
jgi:hypothetical protein